MAKAKAKAGTASAKPKAKAAAKAKAKPATKDPKGGLTAAGRAEFKKKEGSNLKPGVTKATKDMTPEEMKRKGSFLRRHFATLRGPLVDVDGKPTRLALQAHAWGEPVPKTPEAAKKLADKGTKLLEQYEKSKESSGSKATKTKAKSDSGTAAKPKAQAKGKASDTKPKATSKASDGKTTAKATSTKAPKAAARSPKAKPKSKPKAKAKSADSGDGPGPYTDPALRDRLKAEIERGDKGGKPGQWSARKAQLLAAEYKKAGGGYTDGRGKKTEGQAHLDEWTEQKWTTADGKPAIREGETARYLPEKAWDELTPAEKKATDRKKREASRDGTQFVSNTKAARKARKSST